MKTVSLLLTLVGTLGVCHAQTPETLPAIELDKSSARSYLMTTDCYDYSVTGEFLGSKTRVTGELTFRNDSVRWRNVYVARSQSPGDDFPKGEYIGYMQDFKYRQDMDILTGEFFAKQLPEADVLTMNLVWDAMTFEGIAYQNWDSLKLNEEFRAGNLNSEVGLAYGTFENKDARLSWIGTTEIEGERCAIIKYSLMNNPINLQYGDMAIRGRSHFWGEAYVSLSDKQIEYAHLTEDVLVGVNGNMQYTVRYITFAKE